MRKQSKNQLHYSTSRQIDSVADFELIKAKVAIEQFLYSCSHTIRAPLKSISGLINLLLYSENDPNIDPKIIIQSIEKTVKKMEIILNELEKFLSNSKESIHTQPTHVGAVVNEVLEEFRHLIEENNIDVNVRCHHAVPFYNDKSKLRVVLYNLLLNAIHYRDSTKSKATITVYIKVTPSICTIQIRDNGIGISPEVRPHIYDLFYRGSDRSVGSGVGLYLVKEILNKVEGTILVRSTERKGTTFLISIPNLMDTAMADARSRTKNCQVSMS